MTESIKVKVSSTPWMINPETLELYQAFFAKLPNGSVKKANTLDEIYSEYGKENVEYIDQGYKKTEPFILKTRIVIDPETFSPILRCTSNKQLLGNQSNITDEQKDELILLIGKAIVNGELNFSIDLSKYVINFSEE